MDEFHTPIIKKRHTDEVTMVRFNPTNDLLATMSLDQSLRFFDPRFVEQIHLINTAAEVTSFTFSTKGTYFIAGLHNCKFLIGTVHPIKIIQVFSFDFGVPRQVWLAEDKSYAIFLTHEGYLISFNCKTKKIILKLHLDWVQARKSFISKDGRILFAYSKKNIIHLLKIGTGKIYQSLPYNLPNIYRMHFYEQIHTLYCANIDGELLMINLHDNTLNTKRICKDPIYAFDLNLIHQIMITGGRYCPVRTWDLRDYSLIEKFDEISDTCLDLHVSHNGLFFAAGTSEGYVCIFPIHRKLHIDEKITHRTYFDYLEEEPKKHLKNKVIAEDEAEFILCPYCSAQVEKSNIYCEYCGVDLTEN